METVEARNIRQVGAIRIYDGTNDGRVFRSVAEMEQRGPDDNDEICGVCGEPASSRICAVLVRVEGKLLRKAAHGSCIRAGKWR